MSCETIVYEIEYINDDYDVMLNYRDTICGYDFLETIYESKIGFNSIKAEELINAYKKSNKKPAFKINKDKDYVIYISY